MGAVVVPIDKGKSIPCAQHLCPPSAKGAEKQERPWVFTKNEIEAYDGDNSSRICATYFKIKDAVFADVTVALSP